MVHIQHHLQRGENCSFGTPLDQLWRLWHLWPNPQYGHYGNLAIVAIDTIVEAGNRYRCLKKHLDLRIAASEADFV